MDWFQQEPPFTSALKFLDALRPSSELWGEWPEYWIFRGVRDAEFDLLPSAHRAKIWERFSLPGEVGFDPNWPLSSIVQADTERVILQRFRRHLDNAGLAIPGEWETVEDALRSTGDDEHDWPTKGVVPFIALAQHHGIPTRLLDWTRRGRNAAYFAAADAAANPEECSPLAVWALDTRFVQRSEGTPSFQGITLQLATAPQASNPNLRAQAGLFTFCRGNVTEGRVWSQYQLIDGLCQAESIERERTFKGRARRAPVLRKLTLTRDHFPELLRRLADDGVTAATMFPGHDGVVKSLLEQRSWDRAPEGGA